MMQERQPSRPEARSLWRTMRSRMLKVQEVELTTIRKTAQRISVRLCEAYCIVFSDLKYLQDLPILSVKMFL